MSEKFTYIFSFISFFVFLGISYISFACAGIRKKYLDKNDELRKKDRIKLIYDYAKIQHKELHIFDWICVFLLTITATIAIVAVQLLNMHIIFIFKIFISLILLLSAAVIDYKTNTIPNIISLIFIIVRFVFLPFEYIYQREVFKTLIISGLIGLAATFIVLYIVHKITKSGLGMGDVKALSSLGLMVGISSCLTTILFGMIVASIVGIVLILLKRRTRKDVIPFGPFIYIGFVISVILGVF